MKKLYLFISLVAASVIGWAQDQQFTQFYAVPTQMNPAFAGASVQNRLATQVRNQWSAIPGAFQAYNMAYDTYIPNIRSGLGMIVNHDRAGSGALRSTAIRFQYAYEARIKRNWFFRPSLEMSLVSKNIDFTKLRFYDQMIREAGSPTVEAPVLQPVSYFDFGTGFLTYGPKFWFGVSLFHLNKPNESVYGYNDVPLGMKFSAHGGLRLRIKGYSLTKLDHYVVLAANYQMQDDFDQLDFGCYYEFSPVILGLWYRGLPAKSNRYGYMNHDALAVLLGFQAGKYKVGYSYDITVSRLSIASSAGSHELTVSYQWASKHNQKSMKKRIMPCAKF
ncbi:MAG: type IX secretion system membrane protein PorP/SprF [Flavobacteriales bacterium]